MYDVADIYINDSGYEIAKKLERGLASYKIDTAFIEYLDQFSYHKGEILRANVEAWVKAHNPQPKFSKKRYLTTKRKLVKPFMLPDFQKNKPVI